MQVKRSSEVHDVVIIGSVGVNPGFQLVNNKQNPTITEQYQQAYKAALLACGCASRVASGDVPDGGEVSEDRAGSESFCRSSWV